MQTAINRAEPGETLTLRGVHVAGSSAAFGGGIANLSGAVTLENGSSVTSNTATYGARGIHNNAGTVTLETGVIIRGNSGPQCKGTSETCPNPADGIWPC